MKWFQFDLAIAAAVIAFAAPAHANTYTFAGVTLGGNTVNGTAVITGIADSDVITITLTNNIAGIGNIGQAISGITFQVFDGSGAIVAISPVTTTSQLGQAIDFSGCTGPCDTLAEKTAFNVGGTSADDVLHWGLTTQDPAYINALGFTGAGNPPDELILGAPTSGLTYSSANASILNSDPHQPFVLQTATFGIKLGTSLPSNFQFGNLNMFFGTNADRLSLPEPGSFLLFGTGLLGFAGLGWSRRRKT